MLLVGSKIKPVSGESILISVVNFLDLPLSGSQENGSAICQLKYDSHDVHRGKPKISGIPTTFGEAGNVERLVLHLQDELCGLEVDLSYSIFPRIDTVVCSAKITKESSNKITIEKAMSFSVDLPY